MSIEAKIRAEIEGRIRSGEWAPGKRVPTEHELMATYGVARATANKALSRLATDGLIERKRRAGSFVAPPAVNAPVVGVPDIEALITGRGEEYRWELLTVNLVRRAPPGFPVRGTGSGWLTITGVHHAGDTPFGWEIRWLDLAAVPGAETADFSAHAPGGWLLANVPWTDARHRITAVSSDPEVAGRLNISRKAPCLQVERWTWHGKAPITYARQIFPGNQYHLVENFRAHTAR